MSNDGAKYFGIHVKFENTGNGEFPYRVVVENQTWIIRVNDFPEQDIFTLLIDDEEIVDFNAWPCAWSKPFRNEQP